MTPSPIQLLQLMFRRFKVELDEAHAPDEPPNPYTSIFTFDGVPIVTEVGLGMVDPDHERGRLYLVSLRVRVSNDVSGDQPARKFSPYEIDVEAAALILLPKSSAALADPEDLVLVNGAALLWSAIREQISQLTMRMSAGPVMLPTVHFLDLKGTGGPAPAAAAAAVEETVEPVSPTQARARGPLRRRKGETE